MAYAFPRGLAFSSRQPVRQFLPRLGGWPVWMRRGRTWSFARLPWQRGRKAGVVSLCLCKGFGVEHQDVFRVVAGDRLRPPGSVTVKVSEFVAVAVDRRRLWHRRIDANPRQIPLCVPQV